MNATTTKFQSVSGNEDNDILKCLRMASSQISELSVLSFEGQAQSSYVAALSLISQAAPLIGPRISSDSLGDREGIQKIRPEDLCNRWSGSLTERVTNSPVTSKHKHITGAAVRNDVQLSTTATKFSKLRATCSCSSTCTRQASQSKLHFWNAQGMLQEDERKVLS